MSYRCRSENLFFLLNPVSQDFGYWKIEKREFLIKIRRPESVVIKSAFIIFTLLDSLSHSHSFLAIPPRALPAPVSVVKRP